jgi:hypothetical protein
MFDLGLAWSPHGEPNFPAGELFPPPQALLMRYDKLKKVV